MKVVFTSKASNELGRIARCIERDDPFAAERLVLGIRKRCLALSHNPDAGEIVGARHGAPIRRLVYRPYLVFYVLSPDAARILRVIHGSRSPQAFLRGLAPS